MGGLRSRISLLRLVIAALLVGFVVAGIGDGWWSSPSAEPTVQSFLLDWQQRSYAAAATWTTGEPAAVTTALEGAYSGLNAAAYSLSMGHINQAGKTATAYFTASVNLGQNGAPWVYQGHFQLHLTGAGWKIDWSPSVINPALRPRLRLAMVSTTPSRKPLLDAEGRPLQRPSPAIVIGVRPDRLQNQWATALALGHITAIDPSEVYGWILAAPQRPFLELVTLRPADYRPLARDLRKIHGLLIHHRMERLFTSIAPAVVGSVGTEASSALRDRGIAYRPGATMGLSGLQQAYQDYLAGTPTTEVVAETAAGQQLTVLKTWNGRPPTSVRTTLEGDVQSAAARAVTSVRGSAAIVAVRGSTGQILGVAGNQVSGMPPIDALAGHYPPGGVFTIVSTQALLASGLPVDSPIPCVPIDSVGGQNFRNVPREPNLGLRTTFATDFAHSCGTAFSGLSHRLTARELSNAARGFGLGRPWHLPSPLHGFSGQLGAPGDVAQLAAATIGEGTVRVSPLFMAEVAAEVDSGAWHEPALVTKPDPPHSPSAVFSATTMASLRALMRQVVRSGAAQRADLRGIPVYGQVGTTLLSGSGHRQRWATWFVGYRGDIAFAALEISASSRVSAVPLAASFLRAAPAR